MSVVPVTMEAPGVQKMTIEDVENIIIEHEEGRRGRNIVAIAAASLYGLLGIPTCCCFCCGCCGTFAAPCMVPGAAREAVRKLSPEDDRVFNAKTQAMAGALAMSACTLCLCCGCCGTCGPYGTASVLKMRG